MCTKKFVEIDLEENYNLIKSFAPAKLETNRFTY